jgi:hypothetical protein
MRMVISFALRLFYSIDSGVYWVGIGVGPRGVLMWWLRKTSPLLLVNEFHSSKTKEFVGITYHADSSKWLLLT